VFPAIVRSPEVSELSAYRLPFQITGSAVGWLESGRTSATASTSLDSSLVPQSIVASGNRLAVVIPCYNTSAAVTDVIRRTLTVTDAVLAVDDGSTDDTPEYLKASGARSLRLEQNNGKGVALRAGIEEVLKGSDGLLQGDFDYVVTIDGDGQHNPANIPRLVECARRESADLVIGVRDVHQMPPKSRFGNRVSRMLFFLGTGEYVSDTQSGFRLMSVRLASTLLGTVRWKRYETEAEILSQTVALGFRIATVEIETIYFDRNRRTHFDPFWDSMRVFTMLGRYLLGSLRGRRSLRTTPPTASGRKGSPPEPGAR
jgi:glycosyltransferase involved in cell wall biosynthesis